MCGSDGVSYLSKCEIKRARRCEGKNVTIKKRGKCSGNVCNRIVLFIYLFIYLHYFERVNTFSYTAILPYGPLITHIQSYTNVKTFKTIYKYNTIKNQ